MDRERWNGSSPAPPFDVARRLRDPLAVIDGRSSWNYRELIERPPQRRRSCAPVASSPGDRALLSLENCSEFFELPFGCWAAGLCAGRPTRGSTGARSRYRSSSGAGAVTTPVLAEGLAPLAGTVDTRPSHLDRTLDYDRLLNASRRPPSRGDRPTGPGCSIPPAPPDGRKARRYAPQPAVRQRLLLRRDRPAR